jgi:hypothetical protein
MVCNALDMGKHRWVGWIESREVEESLWKAKEPLRTAWERDQKKTTYPMDTSYELAGLQERISPEPTTVRRVTRMPKPRVRKTIAQLAPEKLVKNIWENQHSGRFEDTVRSAGQMNYDNQEKPWKAFQGIIHAMESTYWVSFFGPEIMSMPKVNILHRRLKQIAIVAGLEGQTQYAEFLDDLCPCALKNHREAVRKMESRSERCRRAPNAESKKAGKKRRK